MSDKQKKKEPLKPLKLPIPSLDHWQRLQRLLQSAPMNASKSTHTKTQTQKVANTFLISGITLSKKELEALRDLHYNA